MAATVPSPESRARIQRLESALLDTIRYAMHAGGVTPPEAQAAAGHLLIHLTCYLCVGEGLSEAEIQAQAEHVASLIVPEVRRHLPTVRRQMAAGPPAPPEEPTGEADAGASPSTP